jgi:hypothetical protein
MEVRELHIVPIRHGEALVPKKTVRKSYWLSGIDGWWLPESFTESHTVISGADPIATAPGHWFEGGLPDAK